MDLLEWKSMDKEFKINILSSAVSSDGHEIENIFNQKGFMVERFVKPPVDIFLDFGFSFCLHEIQCIPSVGAQTSIGIEIFSATYDNAAKVAPNEGSGVVLENSSDLLKFSSSATPRSSSISTSSLDTPLPPSSRASSPPSRAPPPPSRAPPPPSRAPPPPSRPIHTLDTYRPLPFRRLSRVNISPESGSDYLSFVNPRRRHNQKQNNGSCFLQPPHHSSPNSLAHELRHSIPEATDVVDSLRIRIFRTKGSTTPALRCLRIVGEPNWRKIQPDMRDKMRESLQQRKSAISSTEESASLELLSGTNRPFVNDVHQYDNHQERDVNVTLEANKVEKDLLDAITFQVMAIPMILPSGHNVDLSTLERYIAEEGKWGRPPNDPFTNVPFNSSSKPLPNSGLKIRIDKFLANCQDDSIPRTLGHRHQQQQQQQQQHTSNISHEKPCLQPQRLALLPSNGEAISPPKDWSATSVRERPKDGSATSARERSAISTKKRRVSYHETELKSSLDDALSKILKSSSQHRQRETTPQKCGQCKLPSLEGKVYKIVCGHLICRKCLDLTDFDDAASSSSLQPLCADCGNVFVKAEVILHHDKPSRLPPSTLINQ